MVQTDPAIEKSSAPKFTPAEFIAVGKQRLDATLEVQTELLANLQEINPAWVARAQSELDLASELTSRLTAARSLPDAATACQEWASKRTAMLAEDGRRLVTDSQKFVDTGARLFSDGWPSKDP
jgi:hypothetical protein